MPAIKKRVKKAKGAAVKAKGADGPNRWTVIYIHGIGNHPAASVLKCQWDKALFDGNMGDRSRMAYWVNRERYPVIAPGTCAVELDVLDPRVLPFAPARLRTLGDRPIDPIEADIRALGATPAEA